MKFIVSHVKEDATRKCLTLKEEILSSLMGNGLLLQGKNDQVYKRIYENLRFNITTVVAPSAAINNVILFFSCAGRSVASGPAMVDHPRLYGKKRDEDVLMVSCSVIKL